MENIVWKQCADYPKYEVNNIGDVRNISTKKNIAPHVYRGYYSVGLWNGHKRHLVKVHRLVAIAFIDNPYNLPQVNHKDEVKTNNNANNLEWCSCSYNSKYGTRNSRMLKARRLKQGPKMEKAVKQFDIDGSFIAEYKSICEASRVTGLDFSNISKCCRDNCYNKTFGGFIWKFS